MTNIEKGSEELATLTSAVSALADAADYVTDAIRSIKDPQLRSVLLTSAQPLGEAAAPAAEATALAAQRGGEVNGGG